MTPHVTDCSDITGTEWSIRGLIEVLFLSLPGVADENHEVSRSASVPGEIRIRQLRNVSLRRYHQTIPLGESNLNVDV
jgi:hypothetical protein